MDVPSLCATSCSTCRANVSGDDVVVVVFEEDPRGRIIMGALADRRHADGLPVSVVEVRGLLAALEIRLTACRGRQEGHHMVSRIVDERSVWAFLVCIIR